MEDFVTYEQAIKLKELGFNLKCYYHYDTTTFKPIISPNFTVNDGEGERWIYSDNCDLYKDMNYCQYYSAPTLAQAAKWLRVEKGLFIFIWLCAAGYGWEIEKCGNYNCNGTFVAKHDEESGDDENSGMFTTYEKALSAGIDKALKLI